MKRLFFSQSMLDSMSDAGKIKVDQGVLTMLAGDNPAFSLHPAYRLVRTIDSGPDANGLAGQIRSEEELRKIGAEILMDSVLYRDVAYQADPGFIAEKKEPGQRPAEQPEKATAPPADAASDADQLSRFILDNLL